MEQNARFPKEQISLLDYLEKIRQAVRVKTQKTPLSKMQQAIAFSTDKLLFNRLLQVAADKRSSTQVMAEIGFFLGQYFYDAKASKINNEKDMERDAHNFYLQNQWQLFRDKPSDFKAPPPPVVPPGQPIGCDFED